MSVPPSRNDYAGGPRAKPGQTAMMLPTQSLDDDVYVEMVPFRREQFELVPFLTPHPRSPQHLLIKQEPLQGDNNEVFIRQTYSRAVGKELAGDIVSENTQGVIGKMTVQRVPAGTAADTGFNVLESSVVPRDAQTATKTTLSVEEYPTLQGSRWDDELQASIDRTERYVPAGAPGGPNTEIQPINASRSLEIIEAAPTAALDSYLLPFPSRASLDVPNVLRGVKIVWVKESAQGGFNSEWSGSAGGTSYSLSGSEGGDAHSSGSLIPDLALDIKEYWTRSVPTTVYFFFLKKSSLSTAAILTKFGASLWPVFKPETHSITLTGGKVSAQARAQASASTSASTSGTSWDKSEGAGTSYDLSPFVNTRVIPATVHGEIVFEGASSDSLTVTAEAVASWPGYNFPTVNVHSTAAKTISASVAPSILPATSPASVPTSGLYLVDCNVQPARYGYVRVMAEIFDASNLA